MPSVDNEKERIIQQIQGLQDNRIILKVQHAISDITQAPVVPLGSLIDDILIQRTEENTPLQTRVTLAPPQTRIEKLEQRFSPAFFVLSLITLIVFGFILTLVTGNDRFLPSLFLSSTLYYTYYFLWSIFVLEYFILVYFTIRYKEQVKRKQLLLRFLGVVFPPFRLGMSSLVHPQMIWLPFWKWSRINISLSEKVKEILTIPMIIIAILIIPVLLVDQKYHSDLQHMFPGMDIDFWMQVIQALIWVAFTFEFILLFSISDSKLDYCTKNWIDLLIIVLPLISFFRSFRALRILRLNQLAKGYRLRGVIMRAKQLLILVDIIHRVIYFTPKRQLKNIQRKLRKNYQERLELEKMALKTIEKIEKKEQKKIASKTKSKEWEYNFKLSKVSKF